VVSHSSARYFLNFLRMRRTFTSKYVGLGSTLWTTFLTALVSG
jgi:hypothetical protein